LAVIIELNDIEPAAAIFFVIKFEHKVVEEDVPAHNVILEDLVEDAHSLIIIDLQ
jgi:hypothetical protein